MTSDVNKVILRCSVGCLRHVVGISYFGKEDAPWDNEPPEMYFETLHEPCEGFWARLKSATLFVLRRQPMGSDSTLLDPLQAAKLRDACDQYMQDYSEWEEEQGAARQTQKHD